MKLKTASVSLHDLLLTTGGIALLVGAGFAVTYQFVQPAPPNRIVITTGSEAGAYYHFATRYATLLARAGVRLEVLTAAGSLENIQRLEQGEAQVGFVQGGIIPTKKECESSEEECEPEEGTLLSLGSVFYEPIWVFYRGETRVTRLEQLQGKKVAIGLPGSGIRQLSEQLLAANGIATNGQLLSLSTQESVQALQEGDIDAAFVIGAQEASAVRTLLQSPSVRLMSFSQADAYQRRFPYLTKLTLPHGVVDLAKDLPSEDTNLVAATANLVVRNDLHPALQNLLLQAATEIHGKVGFFQKAREFPVYRDQTLPLSGEAERYYKSGPPFLQRYLPFWLAVLFQRLLVLVVPLIALLLPLLKVAPSVYSWRIKSRIFHCYGELKVLETELRGNFTPIKFPEYQQRLDTIEAEASNLVVPLAFTDLVYTLREHVNLVRRTLEKLEK